MQCQPLLNGEWYTVRAIARVEEGGGGGGGFSLTPLQINDIHDYCYALEKLRAENNVLTV